jgi:hypothetical protein
VPKVEKIRSFNLPDPQKGLLRLVAGKLYLYLYLYTTATGYRNISRTKKKIP